MVRVRKPDQVPPGTHYAVIVYETTSVHVPGDERSRTCPGHGYPAHTDNYEVFEHWVTTNPQVLQAFVRELEGERTGRFPRSTAPYVVLEIAKKASVTTTTRVEIG